MGYNVKNYLSMDRYVDGRKKASQPKPEAEVDAVVKTITSVRPDVLGLVEMGTTADFDDLRTRLARAGLPYAHAKHHKGVDDNRHIALLSNYPIIADNSRADYSYEIEGSREFIQRGVLDVTLDLGGGYELRVVGAHLKSRRPVPLGEARMRRYEAELLRSHVEKILAADPKTNLLVWGDLNDLKREPPIETIIGRRGSDDYLAEIRVEDPFGFVWTYYSSYNDVYERIDYLLASPGLMPEIDHSRSHIPHLPEWNIAGDHRPVVTTIVPAAQASRVTGKK